MSTDPDSQAQALRDMVKRHLDAVWKGDNRCPICLTEEWTINSASALPVRPTPGSFFMESAPIYPLCPISCNNCGFTFFINEKWPRGDKGRP